MTTTIQENSCLQRQARNPERRHRLWPKGKVGNMEGGEFKLPSVGRQHIEPFLLLPELHWAEKKTCNNIFKRFIMTFNTPSCQAPGCGSYWIYYDEIPARNLIRKVRKTSCDQQSKVQKEKY